jgi:hypothetical protein
MKTDCTVRQIKPDDDGTAAWINIAHFGYAGVGIHVNDYCCPTLLLRGKHSKHEFFIAQFSNEDYFAEWLSAHGKDYDVIVRLSDLPITK